MKVKAKLPIKYRGIFALPGAIVDVSEGDGKRMISCGIAELETASIRTNEKRKNNDRV